MSFAIGLRIYQITAPLRNSRAPNDVKGRFENKKLLDFLETFIEKHRLFSDRKDLQRGWHMDLSASNNPYMIHGYVHYGTYGFESKLIDGKSRSERYRRRTDDLEEIPLYYKYWLPEGDNFALFAFQSFGGRSCVVMLLEAMRASFEKANKNHALRIKKLMPEESDNQELAKARVKKLTMIKERAPKDLADRYLNNNAPEEVHLEFSIKSRPKNFLGKLSDFMGKENESQSSLLFHDGIMFDVAKALVVVGGRRRTVNVLGYNNDAGVIDLTGDVSLVNGHPNFQEISHETDEILLGFYKTLSKLK